MELALAERDYKKATVFFFLVGPSQKGSKLPGVPNGRGNWDKTAVFFSTKFTIY